MYTDGRDRIGSALRRMAEDLVKERRQVLELKRENRRLRAELERVNRERSLTEQPTPPATRGAQPSASSTTGDAG